MTGPKRENRTELQRNDMEEEQNRTNGTCDDSTFFNSFIKLQTYIITCRKKTSIKSPISKIQTGIASNKP
jgi:hypothetical protein